jgi:predicted nicotinamide N-methyase
MTDKIAVKRGGGNVFADLGFDHPEEEKLMAQLVREIRRHAGRALRPDMKRPRPPPGELTEAAFYIAPRPRDRDVMWELEDQNGNRMSVTCWP